jgi:hypothetical protein
MNKLPVLLQWCFIFLYREMGRGRSPARGRSHPVQPKEVDALATDALTKSVAAWNAKVRFNQIAIDRESIKWMANGNVEITLKLDTAMGNIDLMEFNDFMETQLSSPSTVRIEDGHIVFVAENESILQAVPQYRYRWRTRMARFLESVYAFLLAIGIVFLVLLVVFGLPSIFPGFYGGIGSFIWEGIKAIVFRLFTPVSPPPCQ